MEKQKVMLQVFGSEKPCQSCVHQPSSKETFEWLKAAIERKYDCDQLCFEYIEIENAPQEHHLFAERVLAEEFFYPVVLVDGEVVAEGNPVLKRINKEIEKKGIQPLHVS